VDAIILAGGRGERVAGLTGPFFKPLLEVDGEPLVRRAVRVAHETSDTIPIVVTAPANTEAIHDALTGFEANLIVQREPLGDAHALLTGLLVKPRGSEAHETDERVLVLLSDNTTTLADVQAVTAHEVAVGVQRFDRSKAARFARFEAGRWVQKVPVAVDDVSLACWVGPFVGSRAAVYRATLDVVTRAYLSGDEALIGPNLGQLVPNAELVTVETEDVGTLEAYAEYLRLRRLDRCPRHDVSFSVTERTGVGRRVCPSGDTWYVENDVLRQYE
jgi:hypothetical protein